MEANRVVAQQKLHKITYNLAQCARDLHELKERYGEAFEDDHMRGLETAHKLIGAALGELLANALYDEVDR